MTASARSGMLPWAALLALACAGTSAFAAPPAPAAPVPVDITTADSVTIHGQWFAAQGRAPALLLAPRARGADPELQALAAEFQRRGFGTLIIELRDPAPVRREADTLRYAVMTSTWVEDMVAALRSLRSRTDGTGHVFAWGQGVGAGLAVAAIGRGTALCDAVAVEDFFPSTDFVMRQNGTAVIPEAVKAQGRLLRRLDEPHAAATRLNLPLLAILVGTDAGSPQDPVEKVLRLNRGRNDRWLRPGVTSPPPTPGPAEVDTLGAWFRRWTAFPPITPRATGAPRRSR